MMLRPVTPADAPLLQTWLSDKALLELVDLGPPCIDQPFQIYIVENASGKAVGWADLHNIDVSNGKAEMGGAIPDPAGRGLSYRAAKELLRVAFDEVGLHRIVARTLSDNTQAKRLLRLLGFEMEGVERDSIYRSGRWLDVEVYSKLAEGV